jgi:hypothetical protein
MNIPLKKPRRSIAVVAIASGIALMLSGCASASSAPPSDGPIYLFDGELKAVPDSQELEWDTDITASSSPTNSEEPIMCPSGTTSVATFLSPRGSERTVSQWTAWENLGYGKEMDHVLDAPLTPTRLGSGAGQGAGANGGAFSLGVACLSNNNLDVTAAFYRTITVKQGGNWTADPLSVSTPK